jgi:glycosyltransferase involved in cell wall biosynthesis
MKPLEILWIIPKWTFPVTDGARVATDSLIRGTIASGAKVDVLCLSQKNEETDIDLMKNKWGVNQVTILTRNLPESGRKKGLYYLKSLLMRPCIPLTFSSFTDKTLQNKISNYLKNNHYDYILLDGLHLGAAFINNGRFQKPEARIIYRAHNIEVDLWKKAYLEKKNPVFKFLLYFQAKLVEKFERQIISNSHCIAAIAQEDLEVLNKMNGKRTSLVSLGLNFSHPLDLPKQNEVKFLFIGRLDWPPNKDGLEWILKEVWPSVVKKRPNAILKIVGSGNKSWLKSYENLPGLQIEGFVKEIKDAYEDCHFTLVPIFYGSGTRIKVIESFAMNRRLISTKMGVQGAGLDDNDYLRAESADEWIKLLSSIELNLEEVNQLKVSRIKVASQLGEMSIGKKFYEWLCTLS